MPETFGQERREYTQGVEPTPGDVPPHRENGRPLRESGTGAEGADPSRLCLAAACRASSARGHRRMRVRTPDGLTRYTARTRLAFQRTMYGRPTSVPGPELVGGLGSGSPRSGSADRGPKSGNADARFALSCWRPLGRFCARRGLELSHGAQTMRIARTRSGQAGRRTRDRESCAKPGSRQPRRRDVLPRDHRMARRAAATSAARIIPSRRLLKALCSGVSLSPVPAVADVGNTWWVMVLPFGPSRRDAPNPV